jgi:hypothetical protein
MHMENAKFRKHLFAIVAMLDAAPRTAGMAGELTAAVSVTNGDASPLPAKE